MAQAPCHKFFIPANSICVFTKRIGRYSTLLLRDDTHIRLLNHQKPLGYRDHGTNSRKITVIDANTFFREFGSSKKSSEEAVLSSLEKGNRN
ncbi:hypothetical protein C4D60_Mb10t24870 [Musa balbisiana]|uniref:Uncharacterized protein n=1 Tax=Musa balbisiana TaxID=52838 RepID=A0A4S8J0H6_MUSBA|nr:hypothetical protein C4D60_Mb10t24870 [Musa balbisiana]